MGISPVDVFLVALCPKDMRPMASDFGSRIHARVGLGDSMLETLRDLVKRYGTNSVVGLAEERHNIVKVACFLRKWFKERYKSFIVANADNPIRVSYLGDASPSQSRCWRKHTIGNTNYIHVNRETVE